MPQTDRGADLGRYQAARIAADVKDKLARTGRAVEAYRRTEVARREAGELDAEILARVHVDRRGERDRHLDDVRRERRDAGNRSGALGNFGNMIERDLGVAGDFRLAGEHGAFFRRTAIIHSAAQHADPAGLALARTAIMRDRNPAGQASINQRLAIVGLDGLAVDDEVERSTHKDSTGQQRARGPLCLTTPA